MVKLASARECRLYGTGSTRNRWEYINAGLYVFATVLLLCGFLAQLSNLSAKSGLVVILISLLVLYVVNIHDLFAHLSGYDNRVSLMGFDIQLALVEFAVPLVHALGLLCFFLGILFFFIEVEKGRIYTKLEMHALNLLIAGSILWLIGSIHNACQIYERADGHVQILQQSVHIPFLIGSVLFVVGTILHRHDYYHATPTILGKSLIWLGMFGSLFYLIGGLMNVVKIFKMHQMDGIGLEKLRGGAQERLHRERECRAPLILEDQVIQQRRTEEGRNGNGKGRPIPDPIPAIAPGSTPYKDVLVSTEPEV